jgi:hypothetical protein
MRRLVLAFVSLIAGVTAFVSDGGAQQSRPASKEQLVGTWTLVRWRNVAEDEHELPPDHSRFLRPPFQFSKRTAGESAEFSRCGVEPLGMIGLARVECGEPAAEPSELIRRQLGDSFGNFFDLHVTQYSTCLGQGKGTYQRPLTLTRHARPCAGHPRLETQMNSKTWMAGTSPAMTR